MGLASMPGTWTRLMRKAISRLVPVVECLDDVCIFSRSMSDYVDHLRYVCEILRFNKFCALQDKRDFGQNSIDFFGHTKSSFGLHVDARKTRSVAERAEPGIVTGRQRFYGLSVHYRRFIHHFATLVLPLSLIFKQDAVWTWETAQRQAFDAIKLALQYAPVLHLPDFDKIFLVPTDASRACFNIASQLHNGNDLPVALFCEKRRPSKINWTI
uniref:Reverse transcriptase/retrotransposon-derived protein RNase H-like domain-containing protein n=1 Tax=Peronospora matthiolae TaxID=2874970 RepID=A0AAV1TR19_9STRA